MICSIEKIQEIIENVYERDELKMEHTVALLFANVHTPLVWTGILDKLGRLNRESGNKIHFFLPGYFSESEMNKYNETMKWMYTAIPYQKKPFFFVPDEYENSKTYLEQKIKADTPLDKDNYLFLFGTSFSQIDYSKYIQIDLDKAIEEYGFASLTNLIQTIITIAKSEIDYDEFEKTLENKKRWQSGKYILKEIYEKIELYDLLKGLARFITA